MILFLLIRLELFSSFYSTVCCVFFFQISLMDLFISFLKTSNVFIQTILKFLSYASATLHFSGPTVIGFLGSSGDIM